MIKVEFLKKEDSTILYFESRTTDSESLSELDNLYEVLMSAMSRTALGGGYDASNKFSIELNNVV